MAKKGSLSPPPPLLMARTLREELFFATFLTQKCNFMGSWPYRTCPQRMHAFFYLIEVRPPLSLARLKSGKRRFPSR